MVLKPNNKMFLVQKLLTLKERVCITKNKINKTYTNVWFYVIVRSKNKIRKFVS